MQRRSQPLRPRAAARLHHPSPVQHRTYHAVPSCLNWEVLENRFVQGIQRYDEKLLPIRTRDVLQKIQSGDAVWETLVPPAIVEIIKANHLFGHVESRASAQVVG